MGTLFHDCHTFAGFSDIWEYKKFVDIPVDMAFSEHLGMFMIFLS